MTRRAVQPVAESRPMRSALADLGVEVGPTRDLSLEKAEWARRAAADRAQRAAELARVEAEREALARRGFVLASVGGVLVALPLATDAEIAAGGTPIALASR